MHDFSSPDKNKQDFPNFTIFNKGNNTISIKKSNSGTAIFPWSLGEVKIKITLLLTKATVSHHNLF